MKKSVQPFILSALTAGFLVAASTPATAELPTFNGKIFAGSGLCASCHNNLKDINKKNVGIVKDESGSMMAHAFVDPLWRAKVRTEIARNPHLTDVIVKKCTSCHAPMANVEQTFAKQKIELFNGSKTALDNPKSDLNEVAMEGVGCTLCHQIQDAPDLGTVKSFSGHYTIGTSADPVERKSYGPFKDVNVEVMQAAVQYTPLYGPQMETSKVCGTCHNLLTPYVDAKGNVLSKEDNEFPEQMAMGEWRLSQYSTEAESRKGGTPKTCQECHMPPTTGVKISTVPSNLPVRDKFFQHTFFSANRLLLELLYNNADDLNIDAKPLKAQLDANQEYLASAADVQIPEVALKDGVLTAKVKVVNKTGHKLPTGIPFRRVILHVTVADDKGNVVFESGKVNPDRTVSGADADAGGNSFEPHYDLITSPDQVQIYEAIMGDSDNALTYTLLRALKFLKDDRILPAGFDKNTAPEGIRPTGSALTDPSFEGGSDTVTYQIKGLTGPQYHVTAALEYQTVSPGFLKDLYRDDTLAEVKAFKSMMEKSKVTHVTMNGTAIDVKK